MMTSMPSSLDHYPQVTNHSYQPSMPRLASLAHSCPPTTLCRPFPMNTTAETLAGPRNGKKMLHSILGKVTERGNRPSNVSIAAGRDTRKRIGGLRVEERLGKAQKGEDREEEMEK